MQVSVARAVWWHAAKHLRALPAKPDLRVMLAAPLQPLLSIPPAFVPQYASLSTAGALVPYKAPEVRRRPERLRATCLCLTPAACDRSAAVSTLLGGVL